VINNYSFRRKMNELRHKMDQKVTNYYKYFWPQKQPGRKKEASSDSALMTLNQNW